MLNSIKYNIRNLITLREFCPIVSERVFFIFGCQRSGTTLLLAILNAHSQIIGLDETEFPSPYPFPSCQKLVYNKIFDYYSCFKMLEHSHKLEFLKKYYPKSKIIWPVRNPYSTILSMNNLVNQEGSWIERCAETELRRLISFYPELNQINFSQLSNVEIGATYWLYKNKFSQILQNHDFDVFTVKYEDLLQNTKETLQGLINFLNLTWDDKLLDFANNNPKKTLAGGTRTDKPIDQSRSNDFDGLNGLEKSKINSICQDMVIDYGYNLEVT